MATELTDPDNDGILEFTQTAEDTDGDQLTVTSELDQIDGVTQSGSDRDPSWFSYTTSSTLSSGTRVVDINYEIDASNLGGAGTTYTFEVVADDGVATTTATFTLNVESAIATGNTFFVDDGGYIDKWDIDTSSKIADDFINVGTNDIFWARPAVNDIIKVDSNGVYSIDPADATETTLFTKSALSNHPPTTVKTKSNVILMAEMSSGYAFAYKKDGTALFEDKLITSDGFNDFGIDQANNQFVFNVDTIDSDILLVDSSGTQIDSTSTLYGGYTSCAAGDGLCFIYTQGSSDSDEGELIKFDISGGTFNQVKKITGPGQLVSNEIHHIPNMYYSLNQERLLARVDQNNGGLQVYDKDLNGIWGDDYLSFDSSGYENSSITSALTYMSQDGKSIARDDDYNVVVNDKDGTRLFTSTLSLALGVFILET